MDCEAEGHHSLASTLDLAGRSDRETWIEWHPGQHRVRCILEARDISTREHVHGYQIEGSARRPAPWAMNVGVGLASRKARNVVTVGDGRFGLICAKLNPAPSVIAAFVLKVAI
jgi:hypothetical protein